MSETISAEIFRDVREYDFERMDGSVPRIALKWGYILNSRTEDDQKGLFEWHGPRDILHWINGHLKDVGRPPETPPRQNGYWERPSLPYIDGLVQQSASCFETLLGEFGDVDRTLYDHSQVDVYNAQDFHYCASLVPNLGTVLDYGAGYGRQSFLFPTQIPGLKLFAVDAVEQTYMLQNWVFNKLGLDLWEYLECFQDATGSRVSAFMGKSQESQVVHIPTWRNDLLPDDYFDLVMFVWCIYEMSEDAARHALETCMRVLKPGGYIYIRDNPHEGSHSYAPERVLEEAGFRLAYYPWKADEKEIHGVPRLYRWTSQSENENDTFSQAQSDLWNRESKSPYRSVARRLRKVISIR